MHMLFVLFAVFRILKHNFHKQTFVITCLKMPPKWSYSIKQRNWDQTQTTKKHEKFHRGQRVFKSVHN